MKKTVLITMLVTLMAFAADQASKWTILHIVMDPPRVIEIAPFFNLRLGFNTGVSFGLFSDALDDWPGALALFKLAIVCGLLFWAITTDVRLESAGLASIAGGALGNAFDRWRQGGVTDFLDFHWGGWHFPTFNIADVAISLGVILIFASAIPALHSRKDASCVRGQDITS